MISASLLYNPKAGSKTFNRKGLIELIASQGIECCHVHEKKKGKQKINKAARMLIVAGGDGTVRKAAEHLLDQKPAKRDIPLAVLPLGTANNIAGTLNEHTDSAAIIAAWKEGRIKKTDVGRIKGLDEGAFFIEAFGAGVFPELMKRMKDQKSGRKQGRDKELRTALEELYDLVLSYKPGICDLDIDGKDHSGKYLMLEAMNIRSIGPALSLAPGADPGDGLLDLVLVPEKERNNLARFIQQQIQGLQTPFPFPVIRAKKIKLKWKGALAHADDELIKMKRSRRLSISLSHEALGFLTG